MIKLVAPTSSLPLVLYCHPSLESQGRWLLDVLLREDSPAKKLRDGFQFALGWSVLTLQHTGDELIVCEPDFSSEPFSKLSQDVTTTLWVLAEQVEMARRIGREGSPTGFGEKVILGQGALKQTKVVLQRANQTEAGDSGWFIERFPFPQQQSNLEAIYAFQLLDLRRGLLPALALPMGFMVLFNGDDVQEIIDEHNQRVWPA